MAPDVDLEYLAKVTVGNNGADLETLLAFGGVTRTIDDGREEVTSRRRECEL